mgnify:CR=1 FL=1
METKVLALEEEQNNLLSLGQSHTHEFLGSTMLAGPEGLTHNHRFAGVTSEAIPLPGGDHKHGLLTNTDFVFQHLHEVAAETGPAIPVGGGKHVHLVEVTTTINRGHAHNLIFTTLIDDPLS